MSINNGEAALVLPGRPLDLPKTDLEQRRITGTGRLLLGGPIIGRGHLVGVIINNHSVTTLHSTGAFGDPHVSEADIIIADNEH